MGEKIKEVPAREQEQIAQAWTAIEKKYSLNVATRLLLPGIQTMVENQVPLVRHKCPNLKLEYELYYRDVSGFAHLKAWALMQSMTESETGLLTVESIPKVGEKARVSNGGWFLRILRLFNEVFEMVPDPDVVGWQEEWARKVGLPEPASQE